MRELFKELVENGIKNTYTLMMKIFVMCCKRDLQKLMDNAHYEKSICLNYILHQNEHIFSFYFIMNFLNHARV